MEFNFRLINCIQGSGNNSPKASPKIQANNSPKASPKSQNAPVKKNPESVLRKVLVRSVVGVSMIAFFAGYIQNQITPRIFKINILYYPPQQF